MAEGQEQDRNEKATPSKLREARKQGQVARSQELTAWAILLVGCAFIYIFGRELIEQNLRLGQALFSQSGDIRLSVHNALRLYGDTLQQLLSALWMLAAAIVVTGLLINFIQVGPVFSWKPLQADFKRLNPATGLKRLFNKKILFELFKTTLKIALVMLVLRIYFGQRGVALMGLLHVDVAAQPAALLAEALTLAFYLLGAQAALALLDFGFVKWDYARNLRMSKRELKEEIKRQDGDPLVKAKIRELQREAARRGGSVQRVPDADVLITNPTHLSIAIRYERASQPAPVVVAKGAGELALKMRQVALRHRVPIVEHRTLARQLFKGVAIDQPILPDCYAAVAAILTQVYRQRESQ